MIRFLEIQGPNCREIPHRVTDSLFATIPLWYSLFGVGYVSLRVEWLCIQFVKCNTGVILSQSTSAWQPLCARYFLQVGWSCWPHSTRWMNHRTVPIVDTSLQSAGSCLWGFCCFWTRLWWHPSDLLGFRLWGTLSVLTSIDGPALLERSRVCQNRLQENPPREDIKCLPLLIPIQQSRLYSQFTSPSEWNVVVRIECRRTSWIHQGPLIDYYSTTEIWQNLTTVLIRNQIIVPCMTVELSSWCSVPSLVSWLRALACTCTGSGVTATRPPLPTRTHKYRNFMSVRVVAWAQDKGTHDAEVRPCRAQDLSQIHLPSQISLS